MKRLPKKVDLQRDLDQHPPVNDPRYKAMRCRNKQWGRYLKWHDPAEFEALYEDWWRAHKELWDAPYQDNLPEHQIPCPH